MLDCNNCFWHNNCSVIFLLTHSWGIRCGFINVWSIYNEPNWKRNPALRLKISITPLTHPSFLHLIFTSGHSFRCWPDSALLKFGDLTGTVATMWHGREWKITVEARLNRLRLRGNILLGINSTRHRLFYRKNIDILTQIHNFDTLTTISTGWNV